MDTRHDSDVSQPTPHGMLTSGQRKQVARAGLRASRVKLREFTTESARALEAQMLRDAVLGMPELAGVGVITSYEALTVEPDVRALNDALLQRFRVLVPITLENLDLSWRDLATGEDLGIEGIALADVILTPGLAVSPRGERLGQGGGCYDRSLPRRREGTKVFTIVHAHEVGYPVPVQPHDELIDGAISTAGVMRFPR